MAGFSSIDNLNNQMVNNSKYWRTDWNKQTPPTTAAVAGEWFCLLRGTGNPPADTVMNTGTNLVFQPLSGTTPGMYCIPSGPNVSGATTSGWKHVLSASACSVAATTMPAVLMLVDLLGFYRVTTVTTTGNQATTNTLTLPRYVTGSGVQCFIYNTNATPLGAATPSISITYTRVQGGTNTTPSTNAVLPVGKTGANNGVILYSGNASGKYGPFMPMADQDSGMQNVTQINLSNSYISGEFSVVLCKPILTIPMTTIGVFFEKDYLNESPSLPKVYDGACLTWLLYNGAATPTSSTFFGHIDFIWS